MVQLGASPSSAGTQATPIPVGFHISTASAGHASIPQFFDAAGKGYQNVSMQAADSLLLDARLSSLACTYLYKKVLRALMIAAKHGSVLPFARLTESLRRRKWNLWRGNWR